MVIRAVIFDLDGTLIDTTYEIQYIFNQILESYSLPKRSLHFFKKNIEIFYNAGWHFNNIMSAKEISLKLKTFAHSEFSDEKFSSEEIIRKKIAIGRAHV